MEKMDVITTTYSSYEGINILLKKFIKLLLDQGYKKSTIAKILFAGTESAINTVNKDNGKIQFPSIEKFARVLNCEAYIVFLNTDNEDDCDLLEKIESKNINCMRADEILTLVKEFKETAEDIAGKSISDKDFLIASNSQKYNKWVNGKYEETEIVDLVDFQL